MSAQPADAADQQPDVRIPESIVARIRELPVLERADVFNTILQIPGARSSWPFPFHAPGDPPDTTYSGLEPSMPHAPAIIYRRKLPGEDGVWRVVDLMDRRAFRDLTTGGLGDNPFVQGVATAVAAAGTVSVGVTGPGVRPVGAVTPPAPSEPYEGSRSPGTSG